MAACRVAAALMGAVPPLLAAACARVPEPRPLVPLEATAVGAVEIYGQGLVATDDSGQSVTFSLDASGSVVAVRVWPGSRLEALYPLRARDTTYFQTGPHRIPVPPPVIWVRVLAPAQETLQSGSQVALEQEAQRCMWNELQRRRPSPGARAPGDTLAQRARPQEPVNLAEIEDRCRRSVGLSGPPPVRQETLVPVAGEYYLLLVVTDAAVDAKRLQLRLAGADISNSSILSVLQALPGVLAGPRARTWAGYAARVGGR
jgi:hypothetical protein